MEFKKAFDKLHLVSLPDKKEERLNMLLQKLADSNVSMDKLNTIQTVLTNSEKYLVLRKSMDAGIVSSDIDAFSNVLSVIIPKFFTNSIIDKIVSVQASDKPFPVIQYAEQLYGTDYAGDATSRNVLSSSSVSAGDSLQKVRTVGYGEVAELAESRTIKASIETKSLTATIKRINAEQTLESIITLMSVMKKDEVYNFIDQKLTKTIYAKLKDEVEFEIINKMFMDVPADNRKDFEVVPAVYTNEPEKLAKYQERISNLIEELASNIHRVYGVRPNQFIVGTDGLNLLDRKKLQYREDDKNMYVGSLGREQIGTFNRTYNVFYDPFMDGHILMGCNYPDAEIFSAVYAPFLVGITPPITEKNANTYRVIYRVDAFETIMPYTLARIDLV